MYTLPYKSGVVASVVLEVVAVVELVEAEEVPTKETAEEVSSWARVSMTLAPAENSKAPVPIRHLQTYWLRLHLQT
jgi:hypothetical protein